MPSVVWVRRFHPALTDRICRCLSEGLIGHRITTAAAAGGAYSRAPLCSRPELYPSPLIGRESRPTVSAPQGSGEPN